MKFFCIADKKSSLGFKLCGIETIIVHTQEEAYRALTFARAKENIGIILITEKVSNFIKAEIEDLIYNQQLPLILEIPSSGEESKRITIESFLKKAVGINV